MAKSLDFSFVPPQSIRLWWNQVERMLEENPETWQNYMELTTIYDEVLCGNMTLAIVCDRTEVVFATLLTLQDFEKCRVLTGVWAAGKDLELVAPLVVSKLKDWAGELGASEFRMENGRMGWTRFMRKFGFEQTRTVISTPIVPQTLN